MRDALRADSSTWHYADTIAIETRDDLVFIRGMVDDLIDNDNLLAVASDVAEVMEVVDALRVRGMKARVIAAGSCHDVAHARSVHAEPLCSTHHSWWRHCSVWRGGAVLHYRCSH